MPRHIILISCVKSKLPHPAPAERLYTSPLFKHSLAYARHLAPDATYILSAKYGLLPLDQQVSPYEQTLKKMRAPDKKAWGQQVLRQLAEVANPAIDHFTILAGEEYYKPLLSGLPNYALPLKGIGLFKRVPFLKSALSQQLHTSVPNPNLPGNTELT